jgi:hypothetical protein
MVNPAKDETARIRRLLERFGAVRDANVFYWFQNRRSRSRRRARQLQQACGAAAAGQLPSAAEHLHGVNDSASHYVMHGHSQEHAGGMMTSPTLPCSAAAAPHFFANDVDGGDDLFAISRQMGLLPRGDDQRCSYTPNDAAQLSHHHPTGQQ